MYIHNPEYLALFKNKDGAGLKLDKYLIGLESIVISLQLTAAY